MTTAPEGVKSATRGKVTYCSMPSCSQNETKTRLHCVMLNDCASAHLSLRSQYLALASLRDSLLQVMSQYLKALDTEDGFSSHVCTSVSILLFLYFCFCTLDSVLH